MADSRFFQRQAAISLSRIAELSGATLACAEHGEMMIDDVAALDMAGNGHISFLDNPKYVAQLTTSNATACLLRAKYQPKAPEGMALLLTEDPYRAYALVAHYFYPTATQPADISDRAQVAASAKLGCGVRVEAGAVIGERAELGDSVTVGANSVIGDGVVIGEGSSIGALCSISHALIGREVIIHRSVHIGQDGFGFAMGRTGHEKVPQLGRVIIGDRVEIGSGTCIDRGTAPDTVIGEGTKIDNLVQIGHNVQIGRHCVIVSQTGISGSTRLDDGVVVGGQVGVAGHLQIGSGAMLAARSGVTHDLEGGKAYGGTPAVPIKDWHRQVVTLNRLAKPTVRRDDD